MKWAHIVYETRPQDFTGLVLCQVEGVSTSGTNKQNRHTNRNKVALVWPAMVTVTRSSVNHKLPVSSSDFGLSNFNLVIGVMGTRFL